MNQHRPTTPTPFYIRRVDENIPDYVARLRAHPPSGPLLVEDPRPSIPRGGPNGRPRRAIEQASNSGEKDGKP